MAYPCHHLRGRHLLLWLEGASRKVASEVDAALPGFFGVYVLSLLRSEQLLMLALCTEMQRPSPRAAHFMS